MGRRRKRLDANERYPAVYIAVDPSSKKASPPPPLHQISQPKIRRLSDQTVGFHSRLREGRRAWPEKGCALSPLPYDKAGEADREYRASFVYNVEGIDGSMGGD